MYFTIANYSSEEVSDRSGIIDHISDDINTFLENKTYGPSIEKLYIGFICVNPDFDQFFQARSKYTKSKKMLEYSLKVDFETFVQLDEVDSRSTILKGIVNSIDNAIKDNGIQDFNHERYKNDLLEFFKGKKWQK